MLEEFLCPRSAGEVHKLIYLRDIQVSPPRHARKSWACHAGSVDPYLSGESLGIRLSRAGVAAVRGIHRGNSPLAGVLLVIAIRGAISYEPH